MPKSTAVSPIRPDAGDEFSFPPEISRVLAEQQEHVYNALEVTKVLSAYVHNLNPKDVDSNELHSIVRSLDAIATLLRDVGGLDEPSELALRAQLGR